LALVARIDVGRRRFDGPLTAPQRSKAYCTSGVKPPDVPLSFQWRPDSWARW